MPTTGLREKADATAVRQTADLCLMHAVSILQPWAPLLAFCLFLTSCDQAARPAPEDGRNAQAGRSASLKQRQMEFLNRIREADPHMRTIDRAMLNEQNELGLILDRSVEMDRIPPLMRTMLTQMAREFPGEDLTVLAYMPSNPPRKIGTARLNARTRDMTYLPEQ